MNNGTTKEVLGLLADFRIAGNHDNWDFDSLGAEEPDEIRAGHFPHAVIRNQDVGSRIANVGERVLGVGEHRDAAAWSGNGPRGNSGSEGHKLGNLPHAGYTYPGIILVRFRMNEEAVMSLVGDGQDDATPGGSPILLVEDSEQDIAIMQRAFETAGILNPVQTVRDAESAIAYLSGTGQYSVREDYLLPALVLLDLNLPGLDGFELLKWIRRTPDLSGLRVIVLSGSGSSHDVNRAFELGANSFIIKDMDFQNTVELARFIQDFWLFKSQIPA